MQHDQKNEIYIGVIGVRVRKRWASEIYKRPIFQDLKHPSPSESDYIRLVRMTLFFVLLISLYLLYYFFIRDNTLKIMIKLLIKSNAILAVGTENL